MADILNEEQVGTLRSYYKLDQTPIDGYAEVSTIEQKFAPSSLYK